MPAGLCKSCPAAVFWAETERGRRMLVDADPVYTGSLRITQRPGMPPLAVVVPAHKRFGVKLNTCSNAAGHRRQKGTRP